MSPPDRIPPRPGQESVWDYPRPAICEPSDKHITVTFGGLKIADTKRAYRVLETSHPPTYYLPPDDMLMEYLFPSEQGSWCEWKGLASYYTIRVGEHEAVNAAWCYRSPTETFRPMADYIAVYPALMDECRVNGDLVRPQAGGFYGGWITSDVVGPFKGEPGTMGW